MFQKYFYALVFFAIVSQSSNAQTKIDFTEEEKDWIAKHPTIHFGYEPNWPPFEMYNDGEYEGIIADYVKIIEKETGIDMIPGPPLQWQESLDKFNKGQIKVLSALGESRNSNNDYAFTDVYIKDVLVIVTRKKNTSIKSIEDITTERVVVPKGYNRVSKLKSKCTSATIVESKDVMHALNMVSNNKADIFIGSLSVVTFYINEYGFKDLKIASSTSDGIIKLCFGVNKEWSVFRDIVQKVFDNLSENDKYAIRAKWVVLRYDRGIKKQELKQYIYISVIIFMIAISLFYLWNKTLRNQIKIRAKAEDNLKESLALINHKNAEKDVLLKEIHHRVKNNLQIVYSMLNMQSREIDNNSEALKIISEGKSRVMAMALIHKILYESDKLEKVFLDGYIKSLINNISQVYSSKKNIQVDVETNNIYLDLDKAIPLGLILNELLTNSYKHAFVNRDSGIINIKLEEQNGQIIFNYKDNGIGVETTTLETLNSLGMRLVKRLSHQLNSEAILDGSNGLKVSITFNL
ncbi:histidine kinase dimerization/phosphoacceptor domain -containing protein [Pseudofulvibacter geojedonensis]|uniref:histidine kinase n=1 Tax=Pseudofulvibacter geojedonensis TaxID=1123758 RepID=A0ABW3I2R3_9FLAO